MQLSFAQPFRNFPNGLTVALEGPLCIFVWNPTRILPRRRIAPLISFTRSPPFPYPDVRREAAVLI